MNPSFLGLMDNHRATLNKAAKVLVSNFEAHPEIQFTPNGLRLLGLGETAVKDLVWQDQHYPDLHTGTPLYRAIKYLTVNTDPHTAQHFTKSASCPFDPFEGSRRFFHGTSLHNAAEILRDGIDLAKGLKYTDFATGNSFYCTEDVSYAQNYALGTLSTRNDPDPEAALLVIDVPESAMEPLAFLNLDGDLWHNYVGCCRTSSGNALNTLVLQAKGKWLSKYDIVAGSISGRSGIYKDPATGDVPSQLCLISEKSALLFTTCITGVWRIK